MVDLRQEGMPTGEELIPKNRYRKRLTCPQSHSADLVMHCQNFPSWTIFLPSCKVFDPYRTSSGGSFSSPWEKQCYLIAVTHAFKPLSNDWMKHIHKRQAISVQFKSQIGSSFSRMPYQAVRIQILWGLRCNLPLFSSKSCFHIILLYRWWFLVNIWHPKHLSFSFHRTRVVTVITPWLLKSKVFIILTDHWQTALLWKWWATLYKFWSFLNDTATSSIFMMCR